MGIYLICFGESEKNINVAIEKKIIGIRQKREFLTDNKAYLIIKRSGEWTVVARGFIGEMSSDNPFEGNINYVTYKLEETEKCEPFGITELLKEEFGTNYGLTLRAPNLITDERFIKEMERRFN